jgi:hydroxymethylbilane synthase
MATRLTRVDDAGVDAVVVAAAALDRLGLADRIAERLDVGVMLPQVGQGALAVECRSGDADARHLLGRIEHAPARRAVDAERGFLAELGGDCSLPAAAHATLAGDTLRVWGLLASPDGDSVVRHELAGPASSGVALGRSVARQLLDDQGGAKLLGRD